MSIRTLSAEMSAGHPFIVENSKATDRKTDAQRITPEERAKRFALTFPKFCPLVLHNDRLYTCWVIGSLHSQKTGQYGSFPHSIKERIYALFPDCTNVCHLFSGTVNDLNTITYDMNPELHPTICDDITNLEKWKDRLQDIDLFIADPPYERDDFLKYRVGPFNKAEAIRALGRVAKPHSFLAWLDTRVPIHNKRSWMLLGYIGVVVSTNTRMRVLTLLERS
jgi:hypothetical protein